MFNNIPVALHKSLQYLGESIAVHSSLGKAFFPTIRKYYDTEREAAIKEYGDNLQFSAQGLNYHFERLDYVISRFETWIQENKLYQNQDAYVFLDSLELHLSELERIKAS